MRVLGYIRVSTDRQDLQRQEQQINDYIEANHHTKVFIYSEEISGAKEIEERKQLSLLLKRTNADADLVVISEMSRYSRQDDLVEVVYSIAKLLKRGLSLVFLDNPSKIYEANSTLGIDEIIMLVAKAFANSEERKKIFERMYSRKIQLIEKYPNVLIGNNVPFGFKTVHNKKYNPKNKNGEPKTFIEVDEDERPVIEELFRRSAEGQTYRELQKYFDANNHRPLKRSKLAKEKYGDLPRQSIYVSNILTNTIYCGERVHSGKVYHIEPIVSKELFLKSVEAHRKNGEFISKSRTTANPLKGLVKCYCGASMALATIRGKKVYTCYRSKKASKYEPEKWCGNYGISQEFLIDIVNWDVKHGLNEELREKYDKATSDKLKEIREELNSYQTKYNILNGEQNERIIKRDNLYNNILPKAFSDTQQKTILKLIDNIENAITQCKGELDSLSKKIQSLREFQRVSLEENKKLVVDDCNSPDFGNYLQTIIDKVIYRGYDVINGLAMIIYKNGFISYYVVRKPRYRRSYNRIGGEIIPISDEFIKFDSNGHVILKNDDTDKVELDSIEQVRELVKKGNRVTILEEKYRAYKQHYNY